MKNKKIRLGMLVMALVFAVAVVGCDNGTTEDQYTLSWGEFRETTHTITGAINDNDWNVTWTQPNQHGFSTGSTANSVYVFCRDEIRFIDGAEGINGSFYSLVNHSVRGFGAPPALRAALVDNRDNVPLAGIFRIIGTGIPPNSWVVFYIRRR